MNPKQDRQGVRTAPELEQKYGFGQFMYEQRQSNQEVKRDLNNLGESLSSYKNENDQNLSRMKETADKQFKQVNESISSVAKDIDALSKALFGMIYPVGSIYISVSATNPSKLFGGTWEQIKDRFLLASGNTYSAGATGGEATHTLTIDEMPAHYHKWPTQETNPTYAEQWWDWAWRASSVQQQDTPDSVPGGTKEVGGNQPHNNMPPYLAVYVWKRTA